MKTISRYIMTLALLLTAVTGAWAQDTFTITFSANGKNKTYTDVALSAEYKCEYGTPGEFDKIIQELYEQDGGHAIENAIPTVTGTTAIIPGLDGPNHYAMITIIAPFTGKATVSGTYAGWSNKSGNSDINYSIEVYFGTPIDVKWDAKAKTGSFVMPAYDVEIAPIYAPTAVFATDGEPTTIEGIIAGEAKDIVKAGTVATTKIGEADPIAQGTVMYAVTTENKKPTSTTGFNATVPTGAVLTGSYTENQTVYVWYYIKGIDAAEGETATAENTFNDSEICTTPITVTVLSNKFDIQFKAANANTIEAGKATVKVGDEAAEVDAKGKLTGVKMNSKVTVTAKEGYKFRKVEVKKGIAPNTITVTWNKDDITGSGNTFTKDGVTVYANRPIDFYYKEFTRGGGFTTTLGNFTKIEVTAASCAAEGTGWTGDDTKKTWTGNAPSVRFNGNIIGRDNIKFVFTIEPTN